MRRAIELARAAGLRGEIPVGAVVVDRDGAVLGEGSNRREEAKNTMGHAEIEAINNACCKKGDWRLDGCTLYVTLEPCPMCAGAIINSRISTVVFGAFDLKAGSMESVVDLTRFPFESRPQVYGGIMEDECSALLGEFFKAVRKGDE